MEGTCKHEKCKLHDLLGGEVEQCPSYVMTTWTDPSGNVKAVHDCAPIRTMLMIQQLMSQSLGLQQAQEQQRNKADILLGILGRAMQSSPLVDQEDKIRLLKERTVA